ncbi:late competence protein ComEC [Staphylococcus petrasii]|uniref:DNA internalization-related competence protein ComEC/Rec2 n=1 Tax=Staphylococcus petrasii TaxID=1276936 RepID=A0A380FYW5_9STAP|nr:DNA internalization-related competence protein ComEC/Rec2 [Staphylococcus petrasii]PNZ29776.1 DNA internalization-related competence protein ComEC/Rec2 [Staphylococcus petrasii]TGE13361.1 DNA internalization-related competence protein ComEC/Rec2 [Staphylococcus petrasii]TGE16173.1 DNA internalization-related competence protein ComEC/Rec2 [Staphylococcus petrasii]SUM44089.1 late competence protein ComEC [Staphylococcus petrasii]
MIYIALSLLSGILWIHLKIFSLFLISLLIFLGLQKHFNFNFLILLIISFISGILVANHNISASAKLNQYYTLNQNIDREVVFNGMVSQTKNQFKGEFFIDNIGYSFTYISKNPNIKASMLENNACPIKGTLSNIINDKAYVFIKEINYKQCHMVTHNSFIERHIKYITNKLQHSNLKNPEKILALITGDMSGIDKEYLDKVKIIGIYHLLAVSGSHIATISFLIHQSLVRFNVPKVLIKLSIIIMLILFAFYTDFAPSALRAILATIIFLVIPRQFKLSSLDILSVVFIGLTISYPSIIYDIGFQFSFLISLFILLSLPLINSLSHLQSLLFLTFIAQLSSSIISIYHFNQLQWIGLFSNLIFVPLYSFIIFPLSILIFIIYHFVNNVNFINHLMNEVFIVHDEILNLFLTFKNDQIFVASTSSFNLLIYFLLSLLSYIFICHKKLLASFLILSTFLVIILYNSQPHHNSITFFDVGQGDSLLFQTNKNETVMVDTGGKESSNNQSASHNISKYHILPSLKSKGISSIDYLILTHPHADHIAEFPYLANHIKIKRLYINIPSYSKEQYAQIRIICKKNNIKIFDATKINTIQLSNSNISFLNSYLPISEDKNEQSIVLLVKYRMINILLMGDATKNNETLLLKRYDLPKIDILKVGHHGSKTSSSMPFLEKIHPSISIISSGKNNKYHLPNQSTIDSLIKLDSKIFNTQSEGEISINLDNHFKTSFK